MGAFQLASVLTQMEPTCVASALVEAVVNGLDAIDERRETFGDHFRGRVSIRLLRGVSDVNPTPEEPITGFEISDDGIGFHDFNRTAFATPYCASKGRQGGRGFARFLFLKHFKSVHVVSHYLSEGKPMQRSFGFGGAPNLLCDESSGLAEGSASGTTLFLRQAFQPLCDTSLEELARSLLDRLLMFFINERYVCPLVVLEDPHNQQRMCLNHLACEVSVLRQGSFDLGGQPESEIIIYKTVKMCQPPPNINYLNLVAHHRVVNQIAVSQASQQRFSVCTYLLSYYFDRHVAPTRASFPSAKMERLDLQNLWQRCH